MAGLEYIICAALCLLATPAFAGARIDAADVVEYRSEFTPPDFDDESPAEPIALPHLWTQNSSIATFHGDIQKNAIGQWDNKDAKIELFITTGIADSIIENQEFRGTDSPAMAGLGLNYNDAAIYTSARIETYIDENHVTRRNQEFRFGLSAFDFEDQTIGSWLMLIANFDAVGNGKIRIKPAFQLFDQDFAGEVDVNRRGDIMLNFKYKW